MSEVTLELSLNELIELARQANTAALELNKGRRTIRLRAVTFDSGCSNGHQGVIYLDDGRHSLAIREKLRIVR